MSSKPLLCLLAGACVVAVGSQSFGQKTTKEPADRAPAVEKRTEVRSDEVVRTRTESTILRSSFVLGSQVSLQGGTEFGVVEEFVLSPGGCIDFIVVNYEDRFYPVPWTIATFNFQERTVLVDVDRTFIQRAPAFAQITEFSNTQLVQKVNSYYKVDERRIDPRPDGGPRNRPGARPDSKGSSGADRRNTDRPAPADRDTKKPGDRPDDATTTPGTKKPGDKPADAPKKPGESKKPATPPEKPAPEKKPEGAEKPDAEQAPKK